MREQVAGRFLILGLGWLCVVGPVASWGAVTVTPDNPFLRYDGIYHPTITASKAVLSRFDDWVYDHPETIFLTTNALNQTGGVLHFRTDSATVTVRFIQEQGGKYKTPLSFAVYQNGTLDTTYATLSFDVTSIDPGNPVTYQITMPAFYNVSFTGLTLDDGSSLLDPSVDTSLTAQEGRPIVTVFGDSISHGSAGLDPAGTHLTWPWVLTYPKGFELFNLSVGAGRTSPSLGTMMATQAMDVAVLLYGHNEWSSNNLDIFTNRTELLLSRLRAYHPDAPIYCITALHTDKPDPPTNRIPGIVFEEFRQAIRDEVHVRQAAGDDRIFLIEGPWFINAQNSQEFLPDMVHPNVEGAAYLGTQLRSYIYPPGYAPLILEPEKIFDLKATNSITQGDVVVDVTPTNSTALTFQIGERVATGVDELHRTLLRFALPDLANRHLEKALLRVSVYIKTSPYNASLMHSVSNNAVQVDASYYESTDFTDTGKDLLDAGLTVSRYYEVDVTDEVQADYDHDTPGAATAAFRLQMDGVSFTGAGHRYLVGTGYSYTNYPGPQLVLVLRDPLQLSLGATGSDARVSWNSVFQETYRIQTCDDLVSAAWTNSVTNIAATPPQNTFTNALPSRPYMFFKVSRE